MRAAWILFCMLGAIFGVYGCADRRMHFANQHMCTVRDKSLPEATLWRDGTPYGGEFVDCNLLRDGQEI